jgi:hypothetical protein
MRVVVVDALRAQVVFERASIGGGKRLGPVTGLPSETAREEDPLVGLEGRCALHPLHHIGERRSGRETNERVDVVGGTSDGKKQTARVSRLAAEHRSEHLVELWRQDGPPSEGRPDDMNEDERWRTPRHTFLIGQPRRKLRRIVTGPPTAAARPRGRASTASLARLRCPGLQPGVPRELEASKTNFTSGAHVGYFLVDALSLGADLRYQRWLNAPIAVDKDPTGTLVDNMTIAFGPRLHFHVGDVAWIRPGIAYARGLDKPMAAATPNYHIVQIDVPVVF